MCKGEWKETTDLIKISDLDIYKNSKNTEHNLVKNMLHIELSLLV